MLIYLLVLLILACLFSCPQNCPAGQYSDTDGSASCKTCPAGQECPSDGTSVPSNCATGHYSLGGASSCTACPIGSYCSSTSAAPVQCDPGYYTSTTGMWLCLHSLKNVFMCSQSWICLIVWPKSQGTLLGNGWVLFSMLQSYWNYDVFHYCCS